MKIFAFASIQGDSIHSSLGTSEYSYYFVLREFYPLLMELGEVELIEQPDERFHSLCNELERTGESVVMLCFTAPQSLPPLPQDVPCKLFPVFAWEFTSLPKEAWSENPYDDWQKALANASGAITHSEASRRLVRKLMGPDYPVWSIPAPVYDRHQHIFDTLSEPLAITLNEKRLTIEGHIYDSHEELSKGLLNETGNIRQHENRSIQASATLSLTGRLPIPSLVGLNPIHELETEETTDIQLGGVVYTTVLNPADGRKNWHNLVKTFCWAMRHYFDATLIIKFVHFDSEAAVRELSNIMIGVPACRCRIVGIGGYLKDSDYQSLINASTYTINISTGEGQCLPLMEFMSAGIPAIAPDHSALEEYINEDDAFVIESSLEPAVYPHDPRTLYRTCQHRVNLDSYARALHESYHVAHHDPVRYTSMAYSARSALEAHCSDRVTRTRLKQVLSEKEPALSTALI